MTVPSSCGEVVRDGNSGALEFYEVALWIEDGRVVAPGGAGVGSVVTKSYNNTLNLAIRVAIAHGAN